MKDSLANTFSERQRRDNLRSWMLRNPGCYVTTKDPVIKNAEVKAGNKYLGYLDDEKIYVIKRQLIFSH